MGYELDMEDYYEGMRRLKEQAFPQASGQKAAKNIVRTFDDKGQAEEEISFDADPNPLTFK